MGERKRHDGACVQARPLGRGVDVFGLGQAGQLVLVARQAAEEDGAADAEDGGTPAEAVRPGVVIVALEDQLVELDGVDDEGDDLQDHCGEKNNKVVLLTAPPENNPARWILPGWSEKREVRTWRQLMPVRCVTMVTTHG